MSDTRMEPVRRGFLSGFIQFVMMLIAAAAMSLSLYQHFGRAAISPAAYEKIRVGIGEAETKLKDAEDKLRGLRSAFGNSDEEVRDFRKNMDEVWNRSGKLDGQFEQTERRMESLGKEIEALLERAKTAELGISTITSVVVGTPEKDRAKIDFAVANGAVILADRVAGSIKLSDTTIRRSGADIVISCMLESPSKNIDVAFYNGSVTTADGTKITVYYVNIGKTSYHDAKFGRSTKLRPGIPVSIQWKMAVPEHHSSFSLIELVLRLEDVRETITYQHVAVP